MRRRTFLASVTGALAPMLIQSPILAHSPWGQYSVYRKKHLLVLSTRDDIESYPYSKLLVSAINRTAPRAEARPARARDLKRAYELLRSDQFQFALLSRHNIDAMRLAKGTFVGDSPVDLKTIYQFGRLEFVVRAEFPDNLVAIVANAIISNLDALPGAQMANDVLALDTLHAGARVAINEYRSHKQNE